MEPLSFYSKLHPPPETPDDEICRCGSEKPIKLMCALSYNPLHCIDCNREIVAESLALSEAVVEEVAYWHHIYDAIDRLWLDSADYESWAKEQLSDINSPVNGRGLAAREKLDRIRRCYYWYFQDQSVDEFEPYSECPRCNKPFGVYAGGIFPQFVCEDCSIITVGR